MFCTHWRIGFSLHVAYSSCVGDQPQVSSTMIVVLMFLTCWVLPGANFNFWCPRLFEIGGLSWRFATTDVIQIRSTRACYFHWTKCANS